MKLLVVDDEELIRNVIKEYAKIENYEVDEASDGNEAVEKALENDYDVIIMDIMMPKRDGFSAIKEIKQEKDTSVIVLSARTMEEDKLNGFDLGIDDYVIKPFSPKELIARIKAVTKRQKEEDIIEVGTIKLSNLTREVTIDNEVITLTHTQFELLKLFLTNLNIALSREIIINKIWGYDYEADDRTIDAHIKLLRSKLKTYRDNIKTIRKVGYKFEYKN
ncbi:MAG: response regulator transcription factor [Tenericutes bacterium]|nr:response regulator transcription factor [Mycoplasmatota bacterium]